MDFKIDEQTMLANAIRLDKIEVARRQLHSYIRLFFHGQDVVSQHTLACAAHTVLYDLSKRLGGSAGSMREPRRGTRAQKCSFVDAFRIPQNFFKHADRDADRTISFVPGVTQFLALDAIRLYALLGADLERPMQAFLIWFQLRYPDVVKLSDIEEHLAPARALLRSEEDLLQLTEGLVPLDQRIQPEGSHGLDAVMEELRS